MTCTFCKAPAVGVCQWPALQFVMVPVVDIRVGEVVRKAKDVGPCRTGRIARVAAILRLQNDWAQLTIQIYSAIDPKKVVRTVTVNVNEIRAERPSVCGAPACEAHARQGGIVTCRDHWEAWQKIA